MANKKYSKKDFENVINREGIYSVSPTFKPNSNFVDTNELKLFYHKLIEKKTLKDDVELMDDIIKERRTIMQHRISCKVDLIAKGRTVASVKVYSVLIEHGMDIVNFWNGITIDPSSFKTYVASFETTMRNLGAKGVSGLQSPTKKETINYVTTVFEFA
ncbi:MAG: hypothetical protein VXZ40_03155 [Nanoarchaeota archaeon]|nr:hypothetical protein [Nanoarchaeota archaeon]